MIKVTSVFYILIIGISLSTSCPNIISRQEWGARPPLTAPIPLQIFPVRHVVLHHSATPTCNHPANCAALVRSMQNHHMTRRHYSDIGFNFLIGEDGNVYEGTGWNNEGKHTKGYNYKSIGICMLGDFTSWMPNEKAKQALDELIECGVRENRITSDYKLIGHQQIERESDCPGRKLFHQMRAWKNWSASPNLY